MLKRFIRYLYEYEHGKRVRNVGFVNVEQGQQESTLHIHGKGLRMAGGDELGLYLFWEENGELFAAYQGDIAFMGPSVNYRLRYTDEDTRGKENYDAVRGILLKDRNGGMFAALWEDTPVDVERIQLNPVKGLPKEEDTENDPDIGESPETADGPEDMAELPKDREGTAKTGRTEEETAKTGGTEEETVEAAGKTEEAERSGTKEGTVREEDAAPSVPEMPDIESEEGGHPDGQSARKEPQKQEIQGETEETEGTEWSARDGGCENPCPRKVTKIQRGEIARLPHCEWRLANNHFLLHGYSNYRHLVLLDDGETLRLGVPGIYHVKEARAAMGFGFPEFIPAEETKLVLSEEECNEEEKFGYWCRQVRRPVR